MNPEVSSLESRGLRVVTRNFISDAGGFGSIFKVKPLKKNENLVEVMTEENPDLDHLSKETWVLKVVRSLKTKSETDKGREYGLIRNLDHPNITKILEVWEEPVLNYPEEVRIFYLMEYANRRSLRHWIQNWKNSRDVYPIILDVLDGLIYLHSEGIIHRDLKPENILLTISSGFITTVKICDFGLASRIDRSQFSVGRGTRGYIAPEIAKGKYSEKVDMFSVGVTFTELVSTCHPSLIQRYIVESVSLGVVFCPLEFNHMYATAITIEEASLASLVTSWNPEERLSASDFYSCLYTYNGKIIRDSIQFYDISPKQLKYVGRPDKLLDWDTVMKHWNIRNMFNLDIITTAIFRYVNIYYGTVTDVLRNCRNLEYVEIVGENKKKHGIPFLTTNFFVPGANPLKHSELANQDVWHPHRKLKTFIFHNLNPNPNYTKESTPYMEALELKNIFYFLPWPFQTYQLEQNQMVIKINLGEHLVVNIDPGKRCFHISGNLGLRLCSRGEFPFERVTIKNLEPNYIGRHNIVKRDQNCEGNEIDLNLDPLILTKLILINTTTRFFNNGRILKKFENLVELHFTGEQIWESLGKKRQIDIQYLPQKLRKLLLEEVRILPLNPNAAVRKLDYFGICHSHLPPNFSENYRKALEVRKIAFLEFVEVENNEIIGFATLKPIFESSCWEEISINNFSWKALTTETISFKNSLEPLFRSSKISVGQSSLQFVKNLSGEINVKQIPQYIHQTEILEEDDFNDFSTPEEKMVPKAVPAFSIPEEGSAIQKLLKTTPQENNRQVDGKYFFDGGEEFNDVPFKFHGKKEIREIYIRNGKIGNLTNQLRGCVNLETLILDHIQLNTFTRIGKYEFPKLKKFHWIEFQHERVKLSLERLDSIIFFEKEGYRNLCGKGRDIVISVEDRMNIVFSLERRELILQHFEGEDTNTLLTSMVCNEGSSVKSLVLGGCTFSNIPALIPFHLTSLHLCFVEGIR